MDYADEKTGNHKRLPWILTYVRTGLFQGLSRH